MAQHTELQTNSVLFWLLALLAVGIILIGIRFLLEPFSAANGFGVPTEGTPTLAYLSAKGTRDVASGMLLITLLWVRAERRVLAVFVSVASLIPVGDLINVYLNVGSNNPTALTNHSGTAVFMLILAATLRIRS